MTATRTPWVSVGGVTGSDWRGAFVGKRAESPFPKALRCLSGALFMGEDLLCQLNIAFGPSGSDVVGDYWLAETRGFRQANAAWDHRPEDVVFEELPKVLLHLTGQISSVIIHGQQNTLDLDLGAE